MILLKERIMKMTSFKLIKEQDKYLEDLIQDEWDNPDKYNELEKGHISLLYFLYHSHYDYNYIIRRVFVLYITFNILLMSIIEDMNILILLIILVINNICFLNLSVRTILYEAMKEHKYILNNIVSHKNIVE
jgi:hypothetical protein